MMFDRTYSVPPIGLLSLSILIATAAVGAIGAAGKTAEDATVATAVAGDLFLPVQAYDSGGSGEAGAFRTVAVGDVNDDDYIDVVVSNFWTKTIGVLLGRGDGTLAPAVASGTGGANPTAVALEDLNHDAHTDLIIGLWSGGVAVRLGHGDGTFEPAVIYTSGGVQVSDVAIGDVNRDGSPDVIVANYGSVLGVLLGQGDGAFLPVMRYPGGSWPFAVAIADIDGDDNPDLLVAGGQSGSVAVVRGNGDGSFEPPATYTGGGLWAQSIAVADVNSDGHPDMVVAICGTGCDRGSAAVFLGNGDGTFEPAVPYDSGGTGANGVAIADVDGDDRSDLLLANWVTNSVGVLLGNGDGTFEPALSYHSGGRYPMSIVAADLNRDGRPDLVVGNECGGSPCVSGRVGILLNNTADAVPPVIAISVTPRVLWPPDGSMVAVTVSGSITDNGSGVNAATAVYDVLDEYAAVQPHGSVTLGPDGTYAFTVMLQSSRLGTDRNGRRYSIVVSATDYASNEGYASGFVTVAHDRRP